MKRDRWNCPVKDCGFWIGPWDAPQDFDVLWYIIEHQGRHIADKHYRWNKGNPFKHVSKP